MTSIPSCLLADVCVPQNTPRPPVVKSYQQTQNALLYPSSPPLYGAKEAHRRFPKIPSTVLSLTTFLEPTNGRFDSSTAHKTALLLPKLLSGETPSQSAMVRTKITSAQQDLRYNHGDNENIAFSEPTSLQDILMTRTLTAAKSAEYLQLQL
jgi:hypothetical protein